MDDIIGKAQKYILDYSIIGRAHYIAWENAARKNKWLGIPVVITTTIVGTAIFGTLQKDDVPQAWKIAAGLFSLLAAVLSALQTTLKYSEQAEKYKTAGARYAAMRRRLDVFVLKYCDESEEKRHPALKELQEITEEFAKLAEESPSIPDKVYDKASLEFKPKHRSGCED